MTQESSAITAIDVGTTKVCTVVGQKSGSDGIRFLGFSSVPCNGLRKGNVFDTQATEQSIRESLRQVQEETGVTVNSAFVGVSGSHVSYVNRRDRIEPPKTAYSVLTTDALEEDPKELVGAANSSGRQMIHAVKMSYSVDGEAGIRNPLGMHSEDVHVDSHVVTGDSVFLNKLEQTVLQAGIQVQHLVLEPLASGLAVLTPEEKEHGAVLMDVGGGTTDLVAFRKGRIHYSKVIPVGGWQFTNDIVVAFNTPFQAAEAAKLKYGSADLQTMNIEEQISLPVTGRDMELQVSRLDVCQLIRERAHELARLVGISLDDVQMDIGDNPSIVLTGGASNLPGLASVVQRNLDIPVRQGVPSLAGASSVPEDLKNPSYATAVGILMWAATEYSPSASSAKDGSSDGAKNIVESNPRGPIRGLIGQIGKLKHKVFFSRRNGKGRD